MKKLRYFALIPALLLVIGAGCEKAATNTNDATNGQVDANGLYRDRSPYEDLIAAGPIEIDVSNNGADIDTSDWATYTNEEMGFSFKYPSDWELPSAENDPTILGDAVINGIEQPFSLDFRVDFDGTVRWIGVGHILPYLDDKGYDYQWNHINCKNGIGGTAYSCVEYVNPFDVKILRTVNVGKGVGVAGSIPMGAYVLSFDVEGNSVDPADQSQVYIQHLDAILQTVQVLDGWNILD